MVGKVFISYRRDDAPGDARGLRDALAGRFGKSNIFMDVDNLLVGQRFDVKLAEALDACDVLVAVIGPRWMELLRARGGESERDYVREEIAAALKRRIVVIPVRVGREGAMPAMPRSEDLPEDIRELVLYQKHDVAHERFGRDMAELIDGIIAVRKEMQAGQRPSPTRAVPWGWVAAAAASILVIGYAGAYYAGVQVPWPGEPPAAREKADAELKARAKEVEQLRVAAAKAEEDRKAAQAEAAKLRADGEARRKAEEDAKEKAATAAEAKRKADDAERERLALQKQAEDRKLADAAVEAKRKADEEATRHFPKVGAPFRDCPQCPEMVVVPAGSFTMGSPASEEGRGDDEGPQHRVTIQRPFAVGKFEVTFDEWAACVAGGGCTSNKTPSDAGWGKGRRPVIDVSLDDAKEYVAWLSDRTGKLYRLLTEAEWEYAARAGSEARWSFGDQEGRLGEHAWYAVNAGKQTQPVGRKQANTFGLHDMHGNVWERVEDCWGSNYNGAPSDGSASTCIIGGIRRVARGGSWSDPARNLRSAERDLQYYDFRRTNLGFRVGRTL